MTRKDHILRKVNLKGVGLEIGPLHAPIVLKSEAKIYYLDHLSKVDLIKKYARSNKQSKDLADLKAIVEIDYILKDSISRTVAGNKFDYVVASHVIEHIPDTIGWLKDIELVLNPGGIVALAIPDKRFTFDITRNVSRPADVIGAYFDNLKKPYTSTIYDFSCEYRNNVVPSEVWKHPKRDFSKKQRQYNKDKTIEQCLKNIDPKEYVDVHCSVYTPYSFFEIIKSLIELDLFDYEVAYFHDTEINDMEFHVNLRKSTKSKSEKLKSVPKIKRPINQFDLFKEIEELNKKIFKLENSKSWKVTAPLRKISGLIKPTKK